MDQTIPTPARYQASTARDDVDWSFDIEVPVDGGSSAAATFSARGSRFRSTAGITARFDDIHLVTRDDRTGFDRPIGPDLRFLLADDVLAEIAAAAGCRSWEV